MSTITDNQLLTLLIKMEHVAESNQRLADSIAAQTMALHALAASNEEIVTVLASVAVDGNTVDGGEIPAGLSLDVVLPSAQPETM